MSDATFGTSALFAAAVGHCPPHTVPDEGAVTTAVTAHNREPLGLLTVIAKKLGAAADPSGRDQLSRLVVAVRSSDGADGPVPDGGGSGGGRELLGPLRDAFPGAAVLRTDDEDLGTDVEGYVRALLDGEANWAGYDLAEVARTVAGAVGRVVLSFAGDAGAAAVEIDLTQCRAGGT